VAAAGIPDNVADGYRCVAGPLTELPGAPVLVVGGLAASVGLYAVMSALALGSERVVFVDDDSTRLQIADRLGSEVIDASGRWEQLGKDLARTFPVTVDANVLDHGRDLAIRATAPCGTCTSVSGGAERRASLPLPKMYLNGIRYEIGRVHAHAMARPVLDLVAGGRLDPLELVDAVVPFTDAVDAMTDPSVKVVFRNDGT
jgi:alcohol dehydrogenase